MTIKTIGVIAPKDFPSAAFDDFNRRLADGLAHTDEQWSQFGPSWNAIAYRYIGLAEAVDFLAESFVQDGTSPPPIVRTRQELALFSFVSCSASCLDSAAYSMFSAGALIAPQMFPLATVADRRRVDIRSTAATLSSAFPGDPLGAAFAGLLVDPTYLGLTEWRNVAVHRSSVGRQIRLGTVDPDSLKLGSHFPGRDSSLGPSLTGDYRIWLSILLAGLIGEGLAFLTRRGIP